MASTRRFQLRAVLLCVPVLATAAPISLSGGVLEVSEAECQDGTCCPEPKSTCIVGGYERADKYYKSSGSCGEILPTVPG